MSNRVTLAQLRDMTAEQVSSLPIEHLAMLLEEAADQKADVKRIDDLLNTGLALAFSARANELRKAEGKDTGTVSIEIDGYVVRADLPKKVEWNQAELRRAIDEIHSWTEDPADYITTEHKVSETKYNSWPPAIRRVFEPARTVGVGRPTFKIERAKRRAA